MPCTRCGTTEVTTHVRRVTVEEGVDASWSLELCRACAADEDTRQLNDARDRRETHQHRMASEALVDAIREEIAMAREQGDVDALTAAARFLALMGPELIDGLPADLEELVTTYGGRRA